MRYMMKGILGGLTVALCLAFLGLALSTYTALAVEPVPGEIIDQHNWEKVKDFLPESQLRLIKMGDLKIKIGVGGKLRFPVSENYEKATKEYAGQCKLDPDRKLVGYIAGQPFPDFKTADELMWNWECRWLGDDYRLAAFHTWNVDPRGNTRVMGGVAGGYRRIYYTGRVDMSPKPNIEPNPEGIATKWMVWLAYPFDVKGAATLFVRHVDRTKDDAVYNYIPVLRRIRRYSSALRSDNWGGTMEIYDDMEYFSANILDFKYKYLGVKPMLLGWVPPEDPLEYKTGVNYWPQAEYEPIDCHVIEITPVKDPNYPYSKQILWVPVPWLSGTGACYKEMYDQKGELWKHMGGSVSSGRIRISGSRFNEATQQMIERDIQNNYMYVPRIYNWEYNVGLEKEDFSLSTILRLSR